MDYPKVSQGINNIVGDNVKLLAQLFPSSIKDGQVDFEALKEELGQFEEVDKEKYELTWAGKQDAKKKAQEDVYNRTLNYIEKDSKIPETTENLYIEGDNLEVLKLLRQNYYGAIKMIYIDPPYNTGNDFVYNDNFAMNVKESDIAEGTRDEEGNPLQKNQQSSNRFHANWLNMMYPRLKVAKDLLTDDGVIFISIDDNEVENLKKICNEIFGNKSFVTDIIWQKKTGASDAKGIATITEYVLVYCKDKSNYETTFSKNTDSYDLNRYKFTDEFEESRGSYYIDNLDRGGLQYSDSLNYGIECPDGTITYPNGRDHYINDGWIWKWSKKKIEWARKNNFIEFRKSTNKESGWSVCYKNYLKVDNEDKPIERAAPHKNMIIDILNANAAASMKNLFDTNNYFNYSKPAELVKRLLSYVTLDNSLILDFFSGSATTAHAVMQLNAEDGESRKFICVQLAEKTDENSEAFKAGYPNICEIGKERIRRAGEKIKQEIETTNSQLKLGEELKKVPDIGFKVFRTADTNIKWNLYDEFDAVGTKRGFDTPDELDFTEGFNDIDVVYEVMLRQKDVPLSSTQETLTDIGSRTYLYGSAYLVCLETEITENLIDKLAALDPLPIKFIFRDSAFKDDINLKDETFRRLKSLIERNSGLEKKTYTVEFL